MGQCLRKFGVLNLGSNPVLPDLFAHLSHSSASDREPGADLRLFMAAEEPFLSKFEFKAATHLLHASSLPYHAGFQGFCVVSLQHQGGRSGSPDLH